jgi:hypothetical protein
MHGMAPSNAAANVLKKETGIESKTVKKHLMKSAVRTSLISLHG